MIYKYHLRLFHIYEKFGNGVFYVDEVLRFLNKVGIGGSTSALKHLREKKFIMTVYNENDNRRHYQKISKAGKVILESITDDMIAKYYLTEEE